MLKGQASISCSIHRRLESEQNVVGVDVVFHLGTIMLPERLVFCQKLHLHFYYTVLIIQARKRKDDLWDNEEGRYSTHLPQKGEAGKALTLTIPHPKIEPV